MIKEIKNFKNWKREYKIQFIKRLMKNLFLRSLLLVLLYSIILVIGVFATSFISFEMYSFNFANWTDFARTTYLLACFTFSLPTIAIINEFLNEK